MAAGGGRQQGGKKGRAKQAPPPAAPRQRPKAIKTPRSDRNRQGRQSRAEPPADAAAVAERNERSQRGRGRNQASGCCLLANRQQHQQPRAKTAKKRNMCAWVYVRAGAREAFSLKTACGWALQRISIGNSMPELLFRLF